MIDETVLMPYMPRLLILDVPPMYYTGCNFPSLAFLANSLTFLDI